MILTIDRSPYLPDSFGFVRSLCAAAVVMLVSTWPAYAVDESLKSERILSSISGTPLPPSVSRRASLEEIHDGTSAPVSLTSPSLREAERVVLMDEKTGKILYERNADVTFSPASIAKLITLSLLFDEIKADRISLDDRMRVSVHAWRTGGAKSGSSTMFAEPDSFVPVRDIIYGVAVQSGNDGAIAIAEHLAGTEEQFVHAMNLQAKLFGMTHSHFANPAGWPNPDSRVTARDVAVLVRQMRLRYPKFMPVFATKKFTWNSISQHNRNALLFDDSSGVDGMKTGYVSSSGYSIAATSERDGWRLIGVLSGMGSKDTRRSDTKVLLDWAYSYLARVSVINQGSVIARVPVFGGSESDITIEADGQISAILPRWMTSAITVKAKVVTPLVAPIQKGDVVGEVLAYGPDRRIGAVPVVATRSVPLSGLVDKMVDSFVNAMGWDVPVVDESMIGVPVSASQ